MFAAMRMGLMASKGATGPVVTAAEATIYASSLSTTITLPAGVQVGERLLVFVACQMNVSDGLSTSSSGWTRAAHSVSGATNATCSALFSKTATGSDALVVTCGTARAKSAVSFRIKNVTGVSGAANAGVSTGYIATPPTVTVSPAKPFLCITELALAPTQYADDLPANYGDEVSTTVQSVYYSVFTARRQVASATSETPGAWDVNLSNARFITITAAVY